MGTLSAGFIFAEVIVIIQNGSMEVTIAPLRNMLHVHYVFSEVLLCIFSELVGW